MKTVKKYILTGLALCTLVGCKEKMIELNTKPSTIPTTNLEFVFTSAVNNFDHPSRWSMGQLYRSMELMQYVVRYGEANPYVNPTDPKGEAFPLYDIYYSQYFGGSGNMLQTILDEIAKKPEIEKPWYDDMKAITKVMMAYQAWRSVEQFGAIVYDEAFKAISEGITRPKYEMGKDIYSDILNTLKESVATLSAEANPNVIALGKSDFFYGYVNSPMKPSGGASVAALSNYTVQRERWMKFANVLRLEIAWKMQATQPAVFESVKSEVIAVPNGLMAEMNDGFYYNYKADYDNNPNDEILQISKNYAASENLVNTLKALKDPRLQYLARPNGLSKQISLNYALLAQHYPDTLAKYSVLAENNIFVGQTTNPKYQGFRLAATPSQSNPNFPGQLTVNFKLKNPNFATQKYIEVTYNGEVVKYPTPEEEFAVSLQIVSPAQGRYFVKSGGGSDNNGNTDIGDNVNAIRFDGPGGEFANIYERRSLFTYAKQCFMLAYLDITAGGKSPEQWYKEGIRSAMKELRDDAYRFKIQVATNTSYPKFPGWNPDGVYEYTDDQIEAYINAPANAFTKENVINQAWIHFYQSPENAYNWWKITGLPATKENTTPAQAALQTGAYLEQPYLKSSDVVKLERPRRNVLPDRASTNEVNYNSIKNTLLASPDYGTWLQTNGRVWWDVN